jgi:hypothetical protein
VAEQAEPKRQEYTIPRDLWHRATVGLTKMQINFASGISIETRPSLRETWEFIAKELRFKRETVQKTDKPNVITAEPQE